MLSELLRMENVWNVRFGIKQPKRLGGEIVFVEDFTVVDKMVYAGSSTLCAVARSILDRQTASWPQNLLIHNPRTNEWMSFRDQYMLEQ